MRKTIYRKKYSYMLLKEDTPKMTSKDWKQTRNGIPGKY